MQIYAHSESVKTSINLNVDLQIKLKNLVKQNLIHNQTQFINEAIAKNIEEIEKQKKSTEFLKRIKKIKRVKPIMPSEKLVAEIRSQSIKKVSKK